MLADFSQGNDIRIPQKLLSLRYDSKSVVLMTFLWVWHRSSMSWALQCGKWIKWRKRRVSCHVISILVLRQKTTFAFMRKLRMRFILGCLADPDDDAEWMWANGNKLSWWQEEIKILPFQPGSIYLAFLDRGMRVFRFLQFINFPLWWIPTIHLPNHQSTMHH